MINGLVYAKALRCTAWEFEQIKVRLQETGILGRGRLYSKFFQRSDKKRAQEHAILSSVKACKMAKMALFRLEYIFCPLLFTSLNWLAVGHQSEMLLLFYGSYFWFW